EDGIRDWSVTGVQTCALPILPRAARPLPAAPTLARNTPPGSHSHFMTTTTTETIRSDEAFEGDIRLTVSGNQLRVGDAAPEFVRSEERRVGKEWRSRRSPCR